MTRRNIPREAAVSLARELVRAFGGEDDVPAQVATSLVGADLRDHHSHGVIRLPMLYRRMLAEGTIDPTAEPTVRDGDGATATVDGNSQFGQVVGRRAVETGIELAGEHGIAAVGIKNAAHLGRIGEWAERTADRGFVFAAFVNTGGGFPLVAPPGSTDRRLATNPVAFGVPSFDALDFPIVLDMATSQVAHGKITERAVEDESLPENWAITDSGESLINAEEFQDGTGAMLPLGGHTSGYKGFGLAVVAELFAGILGDAIVAGQDGPDTVSNAAAFLTLDPERFGSSEANRARLEDLTTYLRSADDETDLSAGPAGRDDTALLPGEAEHTLRVEREAAGIPFAQETLDLLTDLAREYDIADAVPDSFETENDR